MVNRTVLGLLCLLDKQCCSAGHFVPAKIEMTFLIVCEHSHGRQNYICVSNFPSMFVVEHQQTAEMLLSHCYGNGCGFWVLIYTSAAPCKDWGS